MSASPKEVTGDNMKCENCGHEINTGKTPSPAAQVLDGIRKRKDVEARDRLKSEAEARTRKAEEYLSEVERIVVETFGSEFADSGLFIAYTDPGRALDSTAFVTHEGRRFLDSTTSSTHEGMRYKGRIFVLGITRSKRKAEQRTMSCTEDGRFYSLSFCGHSEFVPDLQKSHKERLRDFLEFIA